MTTRALFAGALVTTALIAGCGDDDDGGDSGGDEAAIEQAVRNYGVAIADGEATRACALLSPAGRRQIEQQQSALTKRQISSCPPAVRALNESLSPEDAEASREIELEQIEVDGDAATARVVDGNGVLLVRSGESWLIAGFTA